MIEAAETSSQNLNDFSELIPSYRLNSIFDNENNKPVHYLAGRYFRGIPDVMDNFGLLPTQKHFLSYIIKRHYKRGFFISNLQSIADAIEISYSTARRCKDRLVKIGIIVADRTDRGIKFMLTNFFRNIEKLKNMFRNLKIEKLKQKYDELEKRYIREKMTGDEDVNQQDEEADRVFKMNNVIVQNEQSHLNVIKKDLEKDQTTKYEHPPTNEKNHDSVVSRKGSLSYEYDLEDKESEIKKVCDEIDELPKDGKQRFNPWIMVKAASREGIKAVAILKTLLSIKRDWAEIKKPVSIFTIRCTRHMDYIKIEKQNDNERRYIEEHRKIIANEAINCNKTMSDINFELKGM